MASSSVECEFLNGRHVLVVEDDFLIADDLARRLMAQGAEIIGPAATIEAAHDVINAAPEIEFAVLDINLRGTLVFPLAHHLENRGIPFLFCTGYGEDPISDHFRMIRRFEKPLSHQSFYEMMQFIAHSLDSPKGHFHCYRDDDLAN